MESPPGTDCNTDLDATAPTLNKCQYANRSTENNSSNAENPVMETTHNINSNNGNEAIESDAFTAPRLTNSGSTNPEGKEGEMTGSMSGARGGPLFMAGLISPLTSVPKFEASVTAQLTSLQAELSDNLTEAGDFDVSVEDLRIITDEELVDRALKEVFKGAEQTELSSELPLDSLTDRVTQNHSNGSQGQSQDEESGQEIPDNAAANGLSNGSSVGALTHGQETASTHAGSCAVSRYKAQNKRKRGRQFDREMRAAELESDDILKAELLAKIKREQEEDKAKAQLHSLRAKEQEGTSSKSEKMERLKALKFVTSKLKTKPTNLTEHVPVPYPEVVLCIEFYHNIRKDHKTQEFLVLGRQPLSGLRDKIYCLTDQLMQNAGQHVPSAYFLIENVFYNDLRNPRATDYSRPIIDWVKNKRDEALEKWKAITGAGFKKKQRALLQNSAPYDQLPSFRATDMNATCFADLQFRLGVQYLYCHQGDCKHGIVIRDMRLIHPDDVQNKAAYPLLTFQPRIRHRKCSICDIYRAKKVTYDDKWAPTNPSFFCENCYYLLHYFDDGTLMYDDFSVYDYYHE